jgi:hypothetical protein
MNVNLNREARMSPINKADVVSSPTNFLGKVLTNITENSRSEQDIHVNSRLMAARDIWQSGSGGHDTPWPQRG